MAQSGGDWNLSKSNSTGDGTCALIPCQNCRVLVETLFGLAILENPPVYHTENFSGTNDHMPTEARISFIEKIYAARKVF
jgi:hypothetical protein